MEFNEKRAKEAAIDTGAAAGGAIIGHAVLNKLGDLATSKMPSLAAHVPAIGLALILGAQAMELLPDNPLVDSALQGAGVVATMATVRQYGGANTPAAATGTGVASIIAKYVPGFTTDAVAVAVSTTAAATTSTGTQGIGSLMPYRDPAAAALLAGQYQRQIAANASSSLQNLGAAPAARTSVLQNLG